MTDVWIEKFRKEALPKIVDEMKPSRILIFGSRAKGTASDDSDIDIIIISNSFEAIPFIKRMETILKIARLPKHVDYFCYTPEEFSRAKEFSSVIEDALSKFIEVDF